MKNILVLINLSAGAERVAKLALKVAQQTGANVLLCNTFELPVARAMAFAGHEDLQWADGERPFLTVEELTDKLKFEQSYLADDAVHQPQINCLDNTDFNNDKIKQLVIDNQVTMLITGIPDLLDLKTSDLMRMIDKANCPVLVIPDAVHTVSMTSTAYLTDLRYCDIEVVKFLKGFNSKIYVTHVSASGIPDMDDSYAQTLLSEAVAARMTYNKLFLRNIKGNNRKKDLETVTLTASVKFFTIVNRKHYVLERFLSDTIETRRSYHQLPLLIIPYLNWHHHA